MKTIRRITPTTEPRYADFKESRKVTVNVDDFPKRI